MPPLSHAEELEGVPLDVQCDLAHKRAWILLQALHVRHVPLEQFERSVAGAEPPDRPGAHHLVHRFKVSEHALKRDVARVVRLRDSCHADDSRRDALEAMTAAGEKLSRPGRSN
jgi:hypothetical protein